MSGRLLADITKALPNHPVEISVDGSRMTITCGSARFSLPTMPVEDYPQLPAMPQHAGELPGEVFGEAVGQVAVAAGKDDTLPMLTGVRVEIGEGKLTLVATDRFRLAMREFPWEPDESLGEVAVLVPARTLSDAAKTLGTAGAPGRAVARRGRRAARSVRLGPSHDHPAARRGLPEVPPAAARPSTPPRRSSRSTRSSRRSSACRWSPSAAPRSGWSSSTAACACPRVATTRAAPRRSCRSSTPVTPVTIAFNPGYLLDGLRPLHADRAHLSFTTPSRPALLKPVDEDGNVAPGYLYLLMPVRLPG